jgi:hypothetical protein
MESARFLPSNQRGGRIPASTGAKLLAIVLAFGIPALPLLVTLCSSADASAQSLAATERVIQGKVFAASGSPQTGAVVYLKDMKSLEIKTYIAQDGSYRFGQLGTQDDYQLWAEFGGHKSKTKIISSFDSRKFFDVPLHLENK